MAALVDGGRKRGAGAKETIVVDDIAAFDGLERLMVIAAGLDAPIDERGAASEALETRSRLYRGLTRVRAVGCDQQGPTVAARRTEGAGQRQHTVSTAAEAGRQSDVMRVAMPVAGAAARRA